MSVRQRIYNQDYDLANIYLPHDSYGRLKMIVSNGTHVKFHKPQGSRLSMLINGKQRVEL